MLNKKLLWSTALVVVGLALMAAYNRPYRWWPFNDMSEQPFIKPFEKNSLRSPVEGTVAIDDWEIYPDRLLMIGNRPIDEPYQNKEPATPESIAEGEHLFNIYCFPCHGQEMSPDPSYNSPMQKRLLEQPDKGIMPSYPLRVAKDRPDEYIYGTITQGGVWMPRFSYHLSPRERWHVVNYIRSLANKY